MEIGLCSSIPTFDFKSRTSLLYALRPLLKANSPTQNVVPSTYLANLKAEYLLVIGGRRTTVAFYE